MQPSKRLSHSHPRMPTSNDRISAQEKLFLSRSPSRNIGQKSEGVEEKSELDNNSEGLPSGEDGNESDSNYDCVPEEEDYSDTDEPLELGIFASHDRNDLYEQSDQSGRSSPFYGHPAQATTSGPFPHSKTTQVSGGFDGRNAAEELEVSQPKTALQKHEASRAVPITLSKDRTGNREFELIKVAFAPSLSREKPQQGQATPAGVAPQGSSSEPDLGVEPTSGIPPPAKGQIPYRDTNDSFYNPEGLAAASPDAIRSASGPDVTQQVGGSNHTLEEYQTQLRLIEQQNMERRMMALSEMKNSYGAQHANIQLNQPPNDPSSGLGLEDYQSAQSQPGSDGLGSRIEEIDSNAHEISSPVSASIGSLLSLTKALNIPEESTVSLNTLQAYISDLQRKATYAEKISQPAYQVIHCVKQRETQRMYLDSPKWVESADPSAQTLIGSNPIQDVPAFLDKRPNICFLVYRHYEVPSKVNTHSGETDHGALSRPKSETIEATSEELTIAINELINRCQPTSGVASDYETRNLSSPYTIIYHTRGKVMDDLITTLSDRQQHRPFNLLLDYIISQYQGEYRSVDELLQHGKITFPYLKYLFKPGDVVVQGAGSDLKGYLCDSWPEESPLHGHKAKRSKRSSSNMKLSIAAWNLTFDGVFSRNQTTLALDIDYNDNSERAIEDFDIRPLSHVVGADAEVLKRRGEWFWRFRVRHIVSYHQDFGRSFHDSGAERYMIDMMMYRELHERSSKSQAATPYIGLEDMKNERPPDENFIFIMPSTVKGYNLKAKKWVDLMVDNFDEVVWNTKAFESLVLKESTKRLIRALVSGQIEAEKSTDLIRGKGNGLILLLHGGPGTGKTLTAESVAEIAQKPLYSVTCGDIGTEPEAVETYLESVLHLGKTWGCAVLLDEADVFLEQRSLEDLRRNALVSVFLRVLEYYDGILILTSNRVGTFDEAFKSRIQLAVHYENLGKRERKKVWRNFLGRLKELNEDGIDFDDLDDNLDQLAEHGMNGREIRNAITIARQYVRWERTQQRSPDLLLDYEQMSKIISTAGEFDRYIERLNNGATYDQMAEHEGIRVSSAK